MEREKIAKIIRSCIYKPGVAEWEDITSREQKPWLETARAILTDPNITEIERERFETPQYIAESGSTPVIICLTEGDLQALKEGKDV